MKANIPRPLTPKQRAEVVYEADRKFGRAKHKLHDIDIMIALTALRRRGYGYRRLQRFMDDFMSVAGEYGGEYNEAMYEALRVHMKMGGIELEGVI